MPSNPCQSKKKKITVNEVVPLQEPWWVITVNREREILSRYREQIIHGVKRGVLKAINMAKPYKTKQEKNQRAKKVL